jgi:uncharacterized RDD family membrane protein YckC
LAELLARINDDETADVVAPAVGAALTKPTDVSRPKRADEGTLESDGARAFEPEFAGFGARAIGLAVDWLLLDLFLLPGIVLIAIGSTATIVLGMFALVAGFFGATVVYARAVSSTGQSVGNRVAGTKVVDARNGRLVDGGESALRYFLRFVVSTIFFIGFIVAFFNGQRRTFHDKMAGTVVTRPPRESWSIDDEATAPPRA